MKLFENNSNRTIIWVCILIIIGLTLLVATKLIDDFWPETQHVFYRDLILNILPILATTTMISAAWELLGKRSFAKDILNLSKVPESIISSGILAVYKDFKDIDWTKEFNHSNKLIMFLSYAYTFRNTYREKLKQQFENKEFMVIMPDPDNEKVVDELDRRFSYGAYSGGKKGSVKEEIYRAINDYVSMGAKIKLFDGTILSTYYLMDKICIYAPFNHGKEKGYVPAIKAQVDGYFYEFCSGEIDKIINRSRDYDGNGEKKK